MIIESFGTKPLQEVIPSYLYFQYSDDQDLQAFVASYNSQSQSYLNWFLQTPLAVYTNAAISGPLLDWVASGLYGYSRPSLNTTGTTGPLRGIFGADPFGIIPFASKKYTYITQGTSVQVNDDIYKRALTWHLYLGDGRQMSVQWLKRRVARFIFGANGSDISLDALEAIDITFPTALVSIGEYGSGIPYGTLPFGFRKKTTHQTKTILISLVNIQTTISSSIPGASVPGDAVPGYDSGIASEIISINPIVPIFKTLFDEGYLAYPFQAKISVRII